MAGKSRDWTALREEWIDRRLGGEDLSLRAFSEEKGIALRSLKERSSRDGWVRDLEAREEAVAAKVREVSQINHVQARLALLRPGMEAAAILKAELARYRKKLENRKGDEMALEPRELRALGQIAKDLVEVGAGLPKEHVVHHDDVADDVQWNREQQEQAREKVVQLREWKRRRGRRKAR